MVSRLVAWLLAAAAMLSAAEAYGASMFGGATRCLPARTRTRVELEIFCSRFLGARVANTPRACTLGAKMQASDDFETNAMVLAARRGDVAVCALMCVYAIYKLINKQPHTQVNGGRLCKLATPHAN
jgi:hypothetical protein